MEFTLNFKMDNAAFDMPTETTKILDKVARRLFNGETYGTIQDTNGNTVGKWEIEE